MSGQCFLVEDMESQEKRAAKLIKTKYLAKDEQIIANEIDILKIVVIIHRFVFSFLILCIFILGSSQYCQVV